MKNLSILAALAAVVVAATAVQAGKTDHCAPKTASTNCFSYAWYKFENAPVYFYCDDDHLNTPNNKTAGSFDSCEWELVNSCGDGADVVVYGVDHAAIIAGCSGDNAYSTMPGQAVYKHDLNWYNNYGAKKWYKWVGPNSSACQEEEEEEEEEEEVNLDGTYVNGGPSQTLYTVNNVSSSGYVTVTMDGSGPFNWTLVSGNYNVWNSYNNGKNIYLVLGWGNTVTFQVSQNGTSRSVTFY